MITNKFVNATIGILIIILLAGSYFLMMGNFRNDLSRHVKKVEASEGTIEHIEEKLNSLATDKTETPAVKIDTPKEIDREAQAAQKQMQTELSYLKSHFLENEQDQSKTTRTLEEKLKTMTDAESALQQDIANGKKREAELEKQKASLEDQTQKLNSQLAETQEQLTALKTDAAGDSNQEIKRLKGELLIQEKKLEKITGLYDRLKEELKGFSDIIDKKDDALAAKDKEIEGLQTQLNYIALKFADLEKSMNKSEKSQAILADKLNQMKELNSTLQKYITQIDGYLAEQKLGKQISQISEITNEAAKTAKIEAEDNDPQKVQAAALKKQVEVILQSSK